MSIVYLMDPSKATTFAVWDGVVTAEEWSQTVNKFMTEPELHTIRRVIVDAQFLTDDTAITSADIDKMAEIFAGVVHIRSHIKFAVVTRNMSNSTRHSEHALVRQGVSVVIFNFFETACMFLDIPTQETRRILDEMRATLLGGANQ